jgi:transposase InsO family protein
MPMPKDLPSSLQQHGRCYRSAFYVRKLQLPSGHTNALAESFFAALKNELVHRTVFPTRRHARRAIAEYVEVFYNRQRLHSGLAYHTPTEIEQVYRKTQLAA